jgi:hypothetical protein
LQSIVSPEKIPLQPNKQERKQFVRDYNNEELCVCMTYHQQLPKLERCNHQCRMRLPAQEVQTDEEMKQKLLYVHDLECYQEEMKPGLYKHICLGGQNGRVVKAGALGDTHN